LEATTLDLAIAKLAEDTPGAVVLDLILGGLANGESVVAIKTASPATAVILYSGHGAALEAVHQRLGERWICGTLRKPFPPATSRTPRCCLRLTSSASSSSRMTGRCSGHWKTFCISGDTRRWVRHPLNRGWSSRAARRSRRPLR